MKKATLTAVAFTVGWFAAVYAAFAYLGRHGIDSDDVLDQMRDWAEQDHRRRMARWN